MHDHLSLTPHLTPAKHDAAIKQTFLGQAHIAGTGPAGTTCRECVFFHVKGKSPGHYAKRHPEAFTLKRGYCNRPMLNKPWRKIPHYAGACRLFEQNENPPPIQIGPQDAK